MMSNRMEKNLSDVGPTIAETKPTARSQLTNGSQMLPGIDGRSSTARRYRDLVKAYADELGGEASLSETERAMVRQAAAMVVRSEAMQACIVRGETVDDEEMTRLSNAVTRTLNALHRKSRPKPRQNLADYLRDKAGAAA